jgi:hypothetical protein
MARYFFHLIGDQNITDEEGIEFRDSASVRAYAIASARSMMAAEIMAGQLCLSYSIKIEDQTGSLVTVVPFRKAFVSK